MPLDLLTPELVNSELLLACLSMAAMGTLDTIIRNGYISNG